MTNVAVIGAGPAGVISGNYLLKAGFNVTIYEKNERVISTPCGEGISLNAIKKLRHDIGFDSAPYFSSSIFGLKNFFPGGYHAFVYEDGYVLERENWIDGIRRHFEKNGGTVEFGTNIKSIDDINADIIIGADGPNSLARKKIGGSVDICTATQYKMQLDWPNHDLLEFYWDLEISEFYAWNFPKKDYFNVGVIGNVHTLDHFCDKYKIKGDILKFEGYPIPFNGRGIHAGNIYLVGDAAGMANAFSKGGLAPSIYGSDILATCLAEGKGNEYENRIRQHPAFSKQYAEAMKILVGLGQENLSTLGRIAHTHDLLRLPLSAQVRGARHIHLIPHMQTLVKTFRDGMRYAW